MNIHAEFWREEDAHWVAEIPQLPETRAYGATRREAAIGVTIRAFHISSFQGLERRIFDNFRAQLS